MSDFGKERWVKIRKPHRCEWCGQQIEIGSKCYLYKGMYDGEWQNWRMHEECREIYDYEEFEPFENERPALI